MPKLPGSLADVSTTFVPMPEGSYSALIESVDMGKSSKSKVPMITVEYKVIDSEEFKNRKLFDYFTLETKAGEPNEAGLRSLKKLIIAACGEDRANADDFDTDELEGQQVMLVVKQESYDDNGEEAVSNRVKKVLAA